MIIDIYLYFDIYFLCSKTFETPCFLEKCLCFSLIKIEPVSIYPSQAALSLFYFSVEYTFLLKMLSLVLIKNNYLYVCLIWILSNKFDLNQETHFTIKKSLRNNSPDFGQSILTTFFCDSEKEEKPHFRLTQKLFFCKKKV